MEKTILKGPLFAYACSRHWVSNKLFLGKYGLKVVQINHFKFQLGGSTDRWHSYLKNFLIRGILSLSSFTVGLCKEDLLSLSTICWCTCYKAK